MMPFGAEVLREGGVRFRLWAPGAQKVEVAFSSSSFQMTPVGDGYFEYTSKEAKAGTLYRYRIDGRLEVPDPASRFQPQDCEGPSEVVDPLAFRWDDDGWRGRPWREAVLYELHVGTFSPSGDYRGVQEKLKQLKDVGVTAIELMPLADFAGRRNWGYDGVLPYAPDSAYGRPEELKALVQAAHAQGLMVFLDVVYNHFGPKGNYLHAYAPQFFTDRHKTPWGAAIDFSNRQVREYFVQNVLYWLREYRFDGLRFDAVHAIVDSSTEHILLEIARRAAEGPGLERQIHLVLENDANQARFLGPGKYTAQWNDDSHHGYHVLATGEADGYYAAYADAPARHLARTLAEGFAYQGEVSPFSGEKRGEPSGHLAPWHFVDFMQNHDQVGNRAFGSRITTLADEHSLKALYAILLLAPAVPMLFMGEEWGCRQPFLFFCDFEGELGEAVRTGRREEFARFAAFSDPAARSRIPDPIAEDTFRQCVLRWDDARSPRGQSWLSHVKMLLSLRRAHITGLDLSPGRFEMLGERAFVVRWKESRGGTLCLRANCGDAPAPVPQSSGTPIYTAGAPGAPWSVQWTIE